MSLLYDLVRQSIELLPPRLPTDSDVSGEWFARLDGRLAFWNKALRRFQELMGLISSANMFCVIY